VIDCEVNGAVGFLWVSVLAAERPEHWVRTTLGCKALPSAKGFRFANSLAASIQDDSTKDSLRRFQKRRSKFSFQFVV